MISRATARAGFGPTRLPASALRNMAPGTMRMLRVRMVVPPRDESKRLGRRLNPNTPIYWEWRNGGSGWMRRVDVKKGNWDWLSGRLGKGVAPPVLWRACGLGPYGLR